MLVLIVLAVLASVPPLIQRLPSLLRLPHIYLMIGLIGAIALSRLAHLWFSGALASFGDFLKSSIVFFLVLANVTTLKRLRILILINTLVIFFLIGNSMWAHYFGGPDNPYVLHRSVLDEDTLTYEDLPRMRALGVFSDPNDFGQLMLTVLPFVALLWRPRK
jgi:hypothetical protein